MTFNNSLDQMRLEILEGSWSLKIAILSECTLCTPKMFFLPKQTNTQRITLLTKFFNFKICNLDS